MLAQAYLLGGHLRIRIEDIAHIAQGERFASNAQLVEKAVSHLAVPLPPWMRRA